MSEYTNDPVFQEFIAEARTQGQVWVLAHGEDLLVVESVEFEETQSNIIDNAYVITRTWTATDACNNSTPVSQIINVTIEAEVVDTINDQDRCNEAIEDQIDLVTLLPNETPEGGSWEFNNLSGITGTTFNPMGVTAGDYVVSYIYNDGSACPKMININLNEGQIK